MVSALLPSTLKIRTLIQRMKWNAVPALEVSFGFGLIQLAPWLLDTGLEFNQALRLTHLVICLLQAIIA